GVEAGPREAFGLRREAVPAQLRGNVLPGHAEAVEDLGVGHLLALGHVGALQRERGNGRHEVVRQWRARGHSSSPLVDPSGPARLPGVATPTLSTAAPATGGKPPPRAGARPPPPD